MTQVELEDSAELNTFVQEEGDKIVCENDI